MSDQTRMAIVAFGVPLVAVGFMAAIAYGVVRFDDLKAAVRLYFLPITNPRAAWRQLRDIFR